MPIGLAAEKNHMKCVAILAKAAVAEPRDAEKFATLDSLSIRGFAPAAEALSRGHVECVGALAMAGADLRISFPTFFDFHGESLVDPHPDTQPQASLLQAVLSFTTLQCAKCKKFSLKLLHCAKCRMAHYCTRECQKGDWPYHKHCCKRLRKGQDMVDDCEGAKLPEPKDEPAGFTIPFTAVDQKSKHEDDETEDPDAAVWEYNAGSRGQPRWEKYPLRIQQSLENLWEMGSPRFMYRPGRPDSDGKYLPTEDRTQKVPKIVATNYVYWADMLERDLYANTVRAVRRNGSRDTPTQSYSREEQEEMSRMFKDFMKKSGKNFGPGGKSDGTAATIS